MSIIKKTALQSFSISVLALAMVACGGGSDDSKPATNNNTLTTPNEVAKAAAAVIVANMTFDKVLSIGQKGIADRISKGLGNGQNLTCNKNVGAPTYTVVANTATANNTDGIRTYAENCPDGEYLSRGKLVYTCTDDACDSNNSTAEPLMEAVPTILSPTIFGVANTTFANNTYNDVYKANAEVKLEKGGVLTRFFFKEDLMRAIPKQSNTWTMASGRIVVLGGNAFNCTTDGEFTYQATSALKEVPNGVGFESGELKIIIGSEAGKVTFSADGGVKVRMSGQTDETTIPKSTFESYCGLGAVSEWNAKYSSN